MHARARASHIAQLGGMHTGRRATTPAAPHPRRAVVRIRRHGEASVERVQIRNSRSVSPPPPTQTGVKARPRREPVKSGKGASQGTVVGPALAKTGRDRATGVEEEIVDLCDRTYTESVREPQRYDALITDSNQELEISKSHMYSHSVASLLAVAPVVELAQGLYSRCCCPRRARSSAPQNRALRNWSRFGQNPALFWKVEENARHDLAVAYRWSGWARLSNQLRNPQAGAPFTWTYWNQWGNRLRVHAWHRSRKSRKKSA